MGWADYYRRRDAIELVLATGGDRLPYAELAPVREAFPSREDLALALQYRWTQALTGRLDVALAAAERSAHVDHVDHVGTVAAAWRATARRYPALRRLLDGYGPAAGERFHDAIRAEQRMVALAAGLAGHDEPADETARVGAAFLALVRRGPDRPVHGHHPIEQPLHRLTASSQPPQPARDPDRPAQPPSHWSTNTRTGRHTADARSSNRSTA